MAGDPQLTRLLLGLGLRSFSMHPTSLLPVKNQILRSQLDEVADLTLRLVRNMDPDKTHSLLAKLNA
jgi:phosphotransferase system enzyme I (PtsI)